MDKLNRLLRVALFWCFATTSTANAYLFLDESDTISKWGGLNISYLQVVNGTLGAIWRGADGASGPSASFQVPATQTNWAGYKAIRFWVHSRAATNATILLGLSSPGVNGQGDYYFHYFKVDWVGWKPMIVPFSQFRSSRQPTGFHKITMINFNARGWAPTIPTPGTQLTFDRIALHKSEVFPDASVQPPSMMVYNALGEFAAPGGPALPQFETQLGFKCIRFALPGHRYDMVNRRYGVELHANQISQTEVMAIARDLAKYSPNCLVSLDLEHWQLNGAANSAEATEIATNIRMLGTILDWMRAAAPTLKYGYYALTPLRDYWNAIKDPSDPAYKAWQADNNALASVAAKSDVVFPSLYTFYNDPTGWIKYAKANISEAKRFNRPILPFLWPNYHDSTKLKGTRIDGAFFKLQLQTVRSQNVNGVVLWDWALNASGQKMYWNPYESWWTATLGFLFP